MKQPLNESVYSRSVIVVDLYSRNELEGAMNSNIHALPNCGPFSTKKTVK